MVTSVLLNEHHDFLRLVINSIHSDLTNRIEAHQCLALTLVANVGGKEFAEALTQDVQTLLTSSVSRPVVRKKAALCLLRLFRRCREVVDQMQWSEEMLKLLDERELGVLTSVVALLHGILAGECP